MGRRVFQIAHHQFSRIPKGHPANYESKIISLVHESKHELSKFSLPYESFDNLS